MEDFQHLDYYELIGVSRDASVEEIKRAYRRQIGRYHPDRYTNASSTEQAYVRQRTQRINEAYRVLVDPNARLAYNRDHPLTSTRRAPVAGKPAAPERARSAPKVTNPRDHQAELYEHARNHLEAGRYVQATATLRELQQINPFYRDSATLLAQAEAARQGGAVGVGNGASRSSRSLPARTGKLPQALLIGGGIVGILVLVVGLLWLNQQPGQAISVAGLEETPQLTPLSTTDLPPTALPSPTMPPSTSTPMPSITPTTPSPTPTTSSPTATPTSEPEVEQGSLLDEFSSDLTSGPGGFATDVGQGWSVGFSNAAYVITASPGGGPIWSYRTQPSTPNFTIGVNVSLAGGSGGLLLHHSDSDNYATFVIDPEQRIYRLQQSSGGTVATVVEGESMAINTDAGAVNRLVARLEGPRVRMFINGQPVADATVLSESLFYGLVVIAGNQPVEGRFTNFETRTLDSQASEGPAEMTDDTDNSPNPTNTVPPSEQPAPIEEPPAHVPDTIPQQPVNPLPVQLPAPTTVPPASIEEPPVPLPTTVPPAPIEEPPVPPPTAVPVEEDPPPPTSLSVDEAPTAPLPVPTPEGAPPLPETRPPPLPPAAPTQLPEPIILPTQPPATSMPPEIGDFPTPEGVPLLPPGVPTPDIDPDVVIP